MTPRSPCSRRPRGPCYALLTSLFGPVPPSFLPVRLNVALTCAVCVLVQDMLPPGSHSGFSGLHLPFIGFTFTTERYVRFVIAGRAFPGGPCPAHTQSWHVATAGSADFWEGPDSKRLRLCCLCGIVFTSFLTTLKMRKPFLARGRHRNRREGWPQAAFAGPGLRLAAMASRQGPQPLRLAESCLSLGLLVTALVPIGGAGAQPRLTRGEFCRARVSPACDSPVSRRHPRGALSARAAEFCRLSAHF